MAEQTICTKLMPTTRNGLRLMPRILESFADMQQQETSPSKFDKTFANEYSHSKDTHYNSLGKRKVIKSNAITVVREMIENADYIEWEAEKDEEHYADFTNGKDTYNVRIAVENGATKNTDIYGGILVTRIDKNHQQFAYDIVKIMKRSTVGSITNDNADSTSEPYSSSENIVTSSENTSRVKNSSTDDQRMISHTMRALR